MLKNALRNLKNQTFDPIEVLVREATSSDPWGAPSSLMAQIADATNDYTQYPKLFQMLWKRLRDYQIHMHVQKALLLTEYLIRNGSDRFVRDAQHRADDIAKLKRYKYYNKDNEDIAGDIRKKAKSVHDMLMSSEVLVAERDKANQLRQNQRSSPRYTGPSAPSYGSNRGAATAPVSSGGGDPYDNYSTVSREEAARDKADQGVRRSSKPAAAEAAPAAAKPKKKPATKTTGENPFDQPAEENPFDQEAAKPKKKSTKKAQPAAEEEPEEPARIAQPAKSTKSKATKKPAAAAAAAPAPAQADPFGDAFNSAFANPVDPFAPSAAAPTKKSNAKAVLESALGPAAYGQPAARPQANAAQLDLLTSAFEAVDVNQSNPWEEEEAPADGGRVDWGPDKSDDEDETPAPAPARGGGDIWDLANNLANLDNINEKKAAAKAPAGKPGKTMAELQKKKPAVIMGSAIDGFEAPSQPQPAAAPVMGGYGAVPYGYPPQPVQPMYGAPMGAPMGAPYYAPPMGQPMYGAPPPAYGGYGQPMGQPMGQPARRPNQPPMNNDPFPF